MPDSKMSMLKTPQKKNGHFAPQHIFQEIFKFVQNIGCTIFRWTVIFSYRALEFFLEIFVPIISTKLYPYRRLVCQHEFDHSQKTNILITFQLMHNKIIIISNSSFLEIKNLRLVLEIVQKNL